MNQKGKLFEQSAKEENEKWQTMIQREAPLYRRDSDIRSEFSRDYTRIVHCNAYRRLKHKTQVFFSPKNDHICTRIEHVNHVDSISYTIAHYLGLNTELTKAISTAHDLGHSPFGHKGEKVISEILKEECNEIFWHEKNGLNFVDNIELLENDKKERYTLNLTYAVRDGIISHCGEIDENGIKPRQQYIDLKNYTKPNEYQPYTWEGCVVKIADKISYVGRDIEDAISVGVLDEAKLKELANVIRRGRKKEINNTLIINELITDLCYNSDLEKGICFSKECLDMLNEIKQFNYQNIYLSERLAPSDHYFDVVIRQIFTTFKSTYAGTNTIEEIKKLGKYYPTVAQKFLEWLENYWDLNPRTRTNLRNNVMYHMEDPKDYIRAILTYISGMTDNYAIETYNEIISF